MLTTLVIMALAQGAAPAKEPDLPEIMVVGTVPRCHLLPGDPLDSVDLAPAAADSRQQVIKLDPVTGAMGVLLAGSGDLWICQPKFQVIAEESSSAAKRDCLEIKGRRPSS